MVLADFCISSVFTKQLPSLWECGKPRSVRLSKLGGRRGGCGSKYRCPALRAPFPQRIVEIPACFSLSAPLRGAGNQICTSQKPPQNEGFYRFLFRAKFLTRLMLFVPGSSTLEYRRSN